MSEFSKESLKNHFSGIVRIFYCHILSVCLGWAAYPILLMVFARYVTIDVPLSVYSLLATIIYILLLMASTNEMGVNDRKPYKWARYKAKGFVVGAAAGVAIVLLEYVFIALADRFFIVQHPQFLISGINSYVRMILYVPFFWFYSLIDGSGAIIPAVNYLSALIVIPFAALFSGIGYLMGSAGIVLDFGRKRKER